MNRNPLYFLFPGVAIALAYAAGVMVEKGHTVALALLIPAYGLSSFWLPHDPPS